MKGSISTIVYPVKDLARAKALYSKFFGVEPYADFERYVGFLVGNQNISLDPNGHDRGYTGPVPYWDVEDIEQAIQTLVDGGARIYEEIRETEPGKFIASVMDPDGNIIGLVESS